MVEEGVKEGSVETSVRPYHSQSQSHGANRSGKARDEMPSIPTLQTVRGFCLTQLCEFSGSRNVSVAEMSAGLEDHNHARRDGKLARCSPLRVLRSCDSAVCRNPTQSLFDFMLLEYEIARIDFPFRLSRSPFSRTDNKENMDANLPQ